MGALVDLDAPAPNTLPPVVDGWTGKARNFGSGNVVTALDTTAGLSIATRDCSVQAIVKWDPTAQAAVAPTGTLIARGTGASAGERVAYGLELRVVNAALRIGEVRWFWHTVGGTLITAVGGQFTAPASGFMLITATRKWLSATKVVMRYYVGDQLVGEALSASGDIGGSTTGSTCIGGHYPAGVAANYLVASLDQLRVVRGELAPEEVAATWRRLAKHQPDGYRMMRDLLPPAMPVSSDQSSRVQRLLRLIGHGLGFADAQDQNARDNTIPTRAYGAVLEQWEAITKEAPRALDDLFTRRRRVVGHIAQRAGSSPPGIAAALAPVLQCDASQLQILASSNRIDETFATINPLRWTRNVDAAFTAVAGQAQCSVGAGDYAFTDSSRNWRWCATAALGQGIDHKCQVKVTPTSMVSNSEAGIFIGDMAAGNFILLGLRNNGGIYQVVRETFREWAQYSVVVEATTSAVPHWLRIFAQDSRNVIVIGAGLTQFDVGWSTTGPTSGFALEVDLQHKKNYQWAGVYLRSVNGVALGGAVTVNFDDWFSLSGKGDRPNTWYVYRDPALPGTPDLVGADRILQRLRQSHTAAHITTATTARCGVANTVGRTPMGNL